MGQAGVVHSGCYGKLTPAECTRRASACGRRRCFLPIDSLGCALCVLCRPLQKHQRPIYGNPHQQQQATAAAYVQPPAPLHASYGVPVAAPVANYVPPKTAATKRINWRLAGKCERIQGEALLSENALADPFEGRCSLKHGFLCVACRDSYTDARRQGVQIQLRELTDDYQGGFLLQHLQQTAVAKKGGRDAEKQYPRPLSLCRRSSMSLCLKYFTVLRDKVNPFTIPKFTPASLRNGFSILTGGGAWVKQEATSSPSLTVLAMASLLTPAALRHVRQAGSLRQQASVRRDLSSTGGS
eukprot:SM000079S22455  [mRNA]  locus=s79:158611:163472:- [translate_table: standard]